MESNPYNMQGGMQTAWTLSSANCKIPVRHTFTLEQKRILMKHYESGMTGQSLAYHTRINQCAQEAGCDFDIVRNWIGNMRRKRRMEEAQRATMHNYMNVASMPHNQSPESMAKRVRLMSSLPRPGAPGPYFINVHSPTGIHMLRPGQPPPPMGVPLEAHLPPRNTPLSPRDQNIAHVGTVPHQAQQAIRSAMSGAKIEPGEERNDCQIMNNVNNTDHHLVDPTKASGEALVPHQENPEVPVSQGQVFPEDTAPMVERGNHETGSMADMDWKQHELNKILDSVQQSMHQLESLGCDCLMATLSPIDNGTYVAGTEKAIKYFTDIQKIQPMSEFINGSLSPRDNMSVFSDDMISEATEERPQSESDNTKEGQHGENHVRVNARQANGQGTSEDTTEDGEGQRSPRDEGEEERGDTSLLKKDQPVIQSGEEVYIVNKDHYIIATGTLLPSPHRKIELKNFCPAS